MTFIYTNYHDQGQIRTFQAMIKLSLVVFYIITKCWKRFSLAYFWARVLLGCNHIGGQQNQITAKSYFNEWRKMMKKFFAVLVSLALLLSVAVISPAWAGGGKNQNEIGEPFGPGSDAQGNQAD